VHVLGLAIEFAVTRLPLQQVALETRRNTVLGSNCRAAMLNDRLSFVASPPLLTHVFHSFHTFAALAQRIRMPEQYTILGVKVHVYKRPNSSLWQCSSYFAGKNRRTILEIEVRGKRGVGYCKSMPGAVRPFERLRVRLRPARLDGVPRAAKAPDMAAAPAEPWRHARTHRPHLSEVATRAFQRILDEESLRFDREGRPRTAYSLRHTYRHTYICLRLMEGADIHQIAKNCRTSVEMIEKYYAAHIKTRLDATAINVMRPQKYKTKGEAKPTRNPRLRRRLRITNPACKFRQPALS
jgi:hypothetical protein